MGSRGGPLPNQRRQVQSLMADAAVIVNPEAATRSANAHRSTGTLGAMSLRFWALVTAMLLVVGALVWGGAASSASERPTATESVCVMAHCDVPVPDSCPTACPHSPRLAPGASHTVIQVPSLRNIDFAITAPVASRLNLSERLDRPPQ